ncbi:hypothetical protein [Agitococcus lubricus]|uniref:Tetratricopeptide repeat protein n=1 Tax=Agitococcus lubricus TaxID=1077255 RepID=A0A2T5J293_9GAMM|nr:hypothetical protein [Agitococcus lubricus]PTQ90635.1 hypothetical protein C8N29_10234 [Agitococcus lubricus]
MLKPFILAIACICSSVPAYAALSQDKLFSTYSLHDFCLDLVSETNKKNPDFLLSRVAFDQFEQDFIDNTNVSAKNLQIPSIEQSSTPQSIRLNTQLKPINPSILGLETLPTNADKKESSDLRTNLRELTEFKSDFIRAFSRGIKKQLTPSLDRFAPTWKKTLFTPINEQRAYCAMMGDPFNDNDYISYALLLTLEYKDQRYSISDIQDSNLFLSYRDAYREDVPELFLTFLAEKLETPHYEFDPLYQFLTALKERNAKHIFQAYEKLPPKQQANKLFLQMMINAIDNDETVYQQVLTQLSTVIPHDTPSYLLVNLYTQRAMFQEALQNLEVIEKTFGYHPSLDIVRLSLSILKQDNPIHLNHLASALKRDDGYDLIYWNLLKQWVKQGRYEDSLIVLDVLKKRFYIDLNDTSFLSSVEYKELFKSKAYKQWKANNP